MLKPSVLLLITALLSTPGCDSGFRYRPVDQAGKQVGRVSQTIEGIRFEAKEFTVLTGSMSVVLSLRIVNKSTSDVVILGGTLKTNGRKLNASDGKDDQSRTIQAGAEETIWLLWPLDSKGERAADVLTSTLATIWHIRIGKTEHDVQFDFQR